MAQTLKDQLVGRVLDIFTNKGIPGVQVELVTDKSIVETNNDGIFIFNKPNGFEVGEAYSFNLYKEGYITVGHTDNIAMYSSGAINDFAMKPDIDSYLWLTIVDGATNSLLKGVRVQIKDSIKETNINGIVKFDLNAYRDEKFKATIKLNCYYDKIVDLPAKGEKTESLTPNCSSDSGEVGFDLEKAQQTLDRALETRDGSIQGQAEALEGLLSQGYIFNNTNFDGVAFPTANLKGVNFTRSSFQFSNLDNANFQHSDLSHANLNFARLRQTHFEGVIAKQTLFQYVAASKANFKGAQLNESSFFLSDLSGIDFSNADLRGVCLAFCDLTGANFTNADLTDAWLYGSVLDQADFTNAIIKNTEASITVANDVNFTRDQRRELRRIAPPTNRIHQVRISGKTSDEKGFDYDWPDFKLNDSSFDYAHFKLDSGSLTFRDDTPNNPIGAFSKHKTKKGSNVDTFNSFNSKFWNAGHRGEMILTELNERVAFLKENLWKQKLIEGTGEEMQQQMQFIRGNKNTASATPLIWNKDAQLVFLLATGIKDSNEIKNYNWEKSAESRCLYDSSGDNLENSWKNLYPKGCHCRFLPYEHLKIYKKWTQERAAKLKISRINITYYSKLHLLEAFLNSFNTEDTQKRAPLFYTKRNRSNSELSYLFNDMDRIKGDGTLYLSQPIDPNELYLKLPEQKLSYFISTNDLNLPKLPPNESSYNKPMELTVAFDFFGVDTVERYRGYKDVMKVIPKSVALKTDGKVFWEGRIQQSQEWLKNISNLLQRDTSMEN